MGDVTDTMLRPLSIGELFDRAITLLVRNWQPFAIIAAIGVLPSQIAGYLAVAASPMWAVASVPLTLLISVATIAAGIVVAQLYRKQDVDWRGAVLAGLARIPGIFGVGFMMALVVLIPMLVLVGIPMGMGVFKFANIGADIIAVFAALAGGIVFLGAAFATSYALVAMGVDKYSAPDSVGRALALFGRGAAGRTLIFALAQQVIVFGGATLGASLSSLSAAVLHNYALGAAVDSLLLFAVTACGNVLIGVFYFDMAIRREGYDLQAALEAMPS